ncbi:hypothetical protein TYRP_021986 [Tyrophagus putrescentiae]|nr:hypothetical protein TYRP_021986 [Tyrophagus putrescentiae]
MVILILILIEIDDLFEDREHRANGLLELPPPGDVLCQWQVQIGANPGDGRLNRISGRLQISRTDTVAGVVLQLAQHLVGIGFKVIAGAKTLSVAVVAVSSGGGTILGGGAQHKKAIEKTQPLVIWFNSQLSHEKLKVISDFDIHHLADLSTL